MNAIKGRLTRSNVGPDAKKDKLLSEFSIIQTSFRLNEKNDTLGKTPLKYYTEFLDEKVFKNIKYQKTSEDFIGRFYGELMSYSGGDGQTLGIILTPRHITDLMCDLVDVGPDDVVLEQAIETGEKLKSMGVDADCILHSPLVRAKDTALHISEITGIPAQAEPRLTEQNFGRFESTARDGAEFRASKGCFATNYGGGESMLRLGQRIYNLLDEVTASDQTYILVAHNGIARMVHSYFNDMTNEEYAAYGVPNCAVVEYEW